MTCWRATRRARRAVAVLSAFRVHAVGSASLIASPTTATGDKPAEEASADTTSSIEPVPPGPDSLTEAVETASCGRVVASLKNGPVEALVAVRYGDLTLGGLDVDMMRTARVRSPTPKPTCSMVSPE